MASRSPHGERGLKLCISPIGSRNDTSLSSRRAWIEIRSLFTNWLAHNQSLSSRRAWIEMRWNTATQGACCCRSPHGERGLKSSESITCLCNMRRSPHGERGLKWYLPPAFTLYFCVALLTESVDWNAIRDDLESSANVVALLTESVDWNLALAQTCVEQSRSLSSRRAWIEMCSIFAVMYNICVALLTESVDWNTCEVNRLCTDGSRSPHGERGLKWGYIWPRRIRKLSRSPHGERGLKFYRGKGVYPHMWSLSSRRAWIEIRRFTFKASAHYPSLSSRRAWIEILIFI